MLASRSGRLAAGGVDLIILETFGYLDELAEAVTVASGVCGLPIIAQATFADDGRTLGGETPREVARALSELPVAMLGTNCTLGPQRMLAVVRATWSAYSALPVSAQPNAGQPRRVGRAPVRVQRRRRLLRPLPAPARRGRGGAGRRVLRHHADADPGGRGGDLPDTVPRPRPAGRGSPAGPGVPPGGRRPGRHRPGSSPSAWPPGFVVAAGIAPPLGGGADEAAEPRVPPCAERGHRAVLRRLAGRTPGPTRTRSTWRSTCSSGSGSRPSSR